MKGSELLGFVRMGCFGEGMIVLEVVWAGGGDI